MKCEICHQPIEIVKREESEVYYRTNEKGQIEEDSVDKITVREVTSAEVVGVYCGCKECPYVYARVKISPKEEEYQMLTWEKYLKLRDEDRAW